MKHNLENSSEEGVSVLFNPYFCLPRFFFMFHVFFFYSLFLFREFPLDSLVISAC